ncbi:MAG: GntR family transcriptional regulator [Microvirga sp.]
MAELRSTNESETLGGKDRSRLVYDGVRRAIIEQALAPGDKLPEDAIGESFNVSRTLVRGALTRLAAEGLVEQRRNKGAVVASPTLAEARDLFDVRQQLEDLVVQRLAGHLTSRQQQQLLAHVAAEQAAGGGVGAESIRMAGEFHVLLADMTGNALLSRYVGEIVSRSSLILALYGRPHSSECAVSEHRQLVEALACGDASKAAELMKHHLGAVQERALIKYEANGEKAFRTVLAQYAGVIRSEGRGP